MTKQVVILTGNPTITVLAEQRLDHAGVLEIAEWVRAHRPDCVPKGGFEDAYDLLPHDEYDLPHNEAPKGVSAAVRLLNARLLTDNEVLVEIAGRKCYDSFADKAGKKTNREYVDNIASMDPMHASIFYHAKMTFFFAGVSRKFSHQFIRNYVGSDRDEEGSPSQESTRFTHHYGFYIAPPLIVETPIALKEFERECQINYAGYNKTIDQLRGLHVEAKRKEIYEAAAGILSMSAETSFVWTTNPMALRKFLKERCHDAADAETFRFARKLAHISFARWPNLFCGDDLNKVRAELT